MTTEYIPMKSENLDCLNIGESKTKFLNTFLSQLSFTQLSLQNCKIIRNFSTVTDLAKQKTYKGNMETQTKENHEIRKLKNVEGLKKLQFEH
jgi:hypothetical protein